MEVSSIAIDPKAQPSADEIETMQALFPDAVDVEQHAAKVTPIANKAAIVSTSSSSGTGKHSLQSHVANVAILTLIALIAFSPPVSALLTRLTRTDNNRYVALLVSGIIFGVAAFFLMAGR